MSTIDEVRESERRVRELMTALKNAAAEDPDRLELELRNATDEYAKALRELW